MFGADSTYLFDHHIHHLVLGRRRFWADVLHAAEDRTKLPIGFGAVDYGDGFERHLSSDHLKIEVVAFVQLERLARLGWQSDLPATEHPYERHDAVLLLCVGCDHTRYVIYTITYYHAVSSTQGCRPA